jgi:hypothetical protein
MDCWRVMGLFQRSVPQLVQESCCNRALNGALANQARALNNDSSLFNAINDQGRLRGVSGRRSFRTDALLWETKRIALWKLLEHLDTLAGNVALFICTPKHGPTLNVTLRSILCNLEVVSSIGSRKLLGPYVPGSRHPWTCVSSLDRTTNMLNQRRS